MKTFEGKTYNQRKQKKTDYLLLTSLISGAILLILVSILLFFTDKTILRESIYLKILLLFLISIFGISSLILKFSSKKLNGIIDGTISISQNSIIINDIKYNIKELKNLTILISDNKEKIANFSGFGRSYSNGGMNFIGFISKDEEVKKYFIIDSEYDFHLLNEIKNYVENIKRNEHFTLNT